MYLRTRTVTHGSRTYSYHSICESVREGRSVRQRTLVELGRLDATPAREVAELCECRGERSSARIHHHGVGLPLLVDGLLRSTGADRLLRRIGRRPRGASLEPALRLLLTGRLAGLTSTAEVARHHAQLAPPGADRSLARYDLLLRALGRLGDARSLLEDWLDDVTPPGRTRNIVIAAGFCPGERPHGPPLTVEASTTDLLPLALRLRAQADGPPEIVACGVDDDPTTDGGAVTQPPGFRFTDLGHTRTILGRALLEQAPDTPTSRSPGDCSVRPVTGPDGRRYALVRLSDDRAHIREAIHDRVRAAERHLAQLQRDVRAGKVRAEDTIARRAERAIVDNEAWRWIDLTAGPGEIAYTRRTERLTRDLASADEHIVRFDGDEAGAPEALDAVVTLTDLLRHDLSVLPVRHRRPRRVAGHFALCLLAAWLLRALHLRLEDEGSSLSASDAVRLADEARALRFDLRSGPLVGRPPLGAPLSTALQVAGVDQPRAAVAGFISELGAAI